MSIKEGYHAEAATMTVVVDIDLLLLIDVSFSLCIISFFL